MKTFTSTVIRQTRQIFLSPFFSVQSSPVILDFSAIALGVILIVLGVLMLVGNLDIPYLTEIVAIALIVAGVLMLLKKFVKGPMILAIILIAAGVIILVFEQVAREVSAILTLIVGIGLILLGILKLVGKW